MSTNNSTPTRTPKPPAVPNDSPEGAALPKIHHPPNTADVGQSAAAARRTSFNFLRRKSSSETRSAHRSASGGKMNRKQRALAQEEALRKQREAALLPKQPPRLPSHAPLPQIDNFGGYDDARPDSVAIVSNRLGHSNVSAPSMDYKLGAPAPRTPHAAVQPPPVPGSSPSYMDFDPCPQSESMAHRGRYSYASTAISAVNTPRRVRRRKDPTPFNILVIGSKGSGKTSFIEFLRTALALPAKKRAQTPPPPSSAASPDSPFASEYIESEFDGERVGVTLWDSQGLEKSVVDFQLPLITAFLESKFEDTFTEEQKVVRAPGVRDTHIHCVFLVLDPARLDANITDARKKQGQKLGGLVVGGGLDENLDLTVLRELRNKTTVIPIISKADTITAAHMRYLKKTVWDTIKRAKLDPLEALTLDEEDEDDDDGDDDDRIDEQDEDEYALSDKEGKAPAVKKVHDRSSSEAGSETESSGSQSPPTSPPSIRKNHNRKPSAMSVSMQKDDSEEPYLPMSIISPDPYEPGVVGRKFPWGFADPYNPDHCDFARLRESVFSEWRAELREASREQWYEGWRTNRLQRGPSRRTATADGPSRQQLTVPSTNGRAASAGTRQPYRQEVSAGY